ENGPDALGQFCLSSGLARSTDGQYGPRHVLPALVQGGKCPCECLFVRRHRGQTLHRRDERAQSPPDDGLAGEAILTHRSLRKSQEVSLTSSMAPCRRSKHARCSRRFIRGSSWHSTENAGELEGSSGVPRSSWPRSSDKRSSRTSRVVTSTALGLSW